MSYIKAPRHHTQTNEENNAYFYFVTKHVLKSQ